jgi:hypothetical protein
MSWFIQESPLVKKYKKYRKKEQSISSQLVETCLDGRVFMDATRLLGVRKGQEVMLDDEDELPAVMDFALHDCRLDGKTAVEIYEDEVEGKDEIEREILAGMRRSYTSLFRIESVRRASRILVLTDLLTEREPVEMIDVNLSDTAVPGLLIFLRLVPLTDFNMSAGFGFIFPAERETYLLRQHKVIMRKVKSEDTAVQRFVAFFKLNQRVGLEMRYR